MSFILDYQTSELTGIREDAWHLAELLPTIGSATSAAASLSAEFLNSSNLKVVFNAFAQKRQPRTASVMKISRGVGELKCPASPEAEKKREEFFANMPFNGPIQSSLYDEWFNQPF